MNLFLALFLLFAPIVAPPAPPADDVRITFIVRGETTSGPQLTYLVEAPRAVLIVVEQGTKQESSDTTGGSWRATVVATLDRCRGVLTIAGRTLVQQRCVWLPVAGRAP